MVRLQRAELNPLAGTGSLTWAPVVPTQLTATSMSCHSTEGACSTKSHRLALVAERHQGRRRACDFASATAEQSPASLRGRLLVVVLCTRAPRALASSRARARTRSSG